MTIVNPDLIGKIEPGQKFYLDFTKATISSESFRSSVWAGSRFDFILSVMIACNTNRQNS